MLEEVLNLAPDKAVFIIVWIQKEQNLPTEG